MANFCQTYPSISLDFSHEVIDSEVHVSVRLEREEEPEMLNMQYFPK